MIRVFHFWKCRATHTHTDGQARLLVLRSVRRWSGMEEKSKGLTTPAMDGAGRPRTLATEGFVALTAMAGDRAFYRSDLGAPALGNNDGFRMGDLSVRTGEEFAAAFSQRGGADGRSLFNRRNLQPYGYEEFAGQMPFGGHPEICRFGNDYPQAQSFRAAAEEGEYQSDEGFQRAQDDLGSRKMKFMCSFGGKILPRPSDGSLRYVGGETRIITASRGIRLAELMQKMLEIYGQAVLLKYQLPNEDLDALVSVSSDEDLENMMDEYERLLEGSGDGSSRLRVFLFSAADSDLVHLASIGDRRNSERHYVDAVNGIVEAGVGKMEDGISSTASRHLENLIGLDVADNWNSTPWDSEGMSAAKINPRDATNLGHPPLPSSSFSSKQAGSSPNAASVASSSPSGGLKQSGVGDVSVPVFPEQTSKAGGRPYPVPRQPDGGSGFGDLDYGTPAVLFTATSQSELPAKARHDYLWSTVSHPESGHLGDQLRNDANLSGVDSRANLNWPQEKLEASQPMVADRGLDGRFSPLDLQHIGLQQQSPTLQWQHYVDAHQDAYRRGDYIQLPNSDGGQAQQLFQQHSLQSALVNNSQMAIHEGGIYWHSDQAQQQLQQQDDLFGGPFLPNFISARPLGQGVSSAAAKLQVSSDPPAPHLVGRQIGGGGQHVQVQPHPSAPYVEQQPFGARVPYHNDQSNRAFHPSPSPPPNHGQAFDRVVHQHELPYERLPYHQKPPPEQVSVADDSCINQQAMPHVHSDSVLQDRGGRPVHPSYEGIPISQTHHSDGSGRPVPSYAASTALQEGLPSYQGHQDRSCIRGQTGHQGKEREALLSRQQGYAFTRGDIEYGTEQPSSLPHFCERSDESDWILQQRTQEPGEAKVHFVPRSRMGRAEGDEEKQSAELSGSCLAEPAVTYGGIAVSEDLHTLLGLRWGDSYQTHQQTEMFDPFAAPLYQLKQPVAAGNMGPVGIFPEGLQTTRLNAKMNKVAVLRPGFKDQEIRTADPLKEHVMASQPANINSWLPGVTQGSIEERSAGIALNPYIYSAGVEPCVSSSMPMTWWGGNLGTDHAQVEASPSVLKQTWDQYGGQPQDETSILGDTLGTITLGEKSGNSMHVPKQHPAQLFGEGTTAVDTEHLSYVLPTVTPNTRSLEKVEGSVSNPAIVTLTESNSTCVSEQHAMQLQGRRIIDDDNRHSARVLPDILSNTSSLDELKEEDSSSVVATLPAGIGAFDSLPDLSKDSSTPTTVPASKTTGFLAIDDNMVVTNDDPVSIGLLIDQHGTSRELEAMKDSLSKGLPLQTLLVSNKVEDEDVKGELENVAEDVKVQLRSSQEELTKGAEEESIPNPDLNFEESNAEDLDNDEPDAVIAEAIHCGLQTIKNADLEELRELGSGTFGTVYHGKWRGSDVAIKRIKNSCFMGKPSEQDRLRADFWREACMLAHLHHPNVVAFYGVVPDGPGGTLATVTEYMVNGSLKQVMHRKDRTIDRRKRLLIAMDAAFGMEYLHGKNIVHFDLKCENLLVNMRDPQRPICKVGDLGLSKIKHQTLVSGGVRGTLPWMAPELLDGSSSMVSEKVDVFSFGIVMWELLTGEEPYANMHYGAIIGGIVNNTLRPPVPKWCDAAWRLLMERCWSADPSIRPTFTEITNGLRAMAASLPPKGQAHHVHSQAHPQN